MSAEHISTGQAATLMGLSIQTVIRLFDNGELAGFRVSRFRRIYLDSLRAWCLEKGVRLTDKKDQP